MPADPKIVMEEDVVRYVLAASAKQRGRLIAQLEYLQKHSFEPPDFQEKDRSGRWLNVKALKPFLITYWFDGPVEELRIVNIETVR